MLVHLVAQQASLGCSQVGVQMLVLLQTLVILADAAVVLHALMLACRCCCRGKVDCAQEETAWHP